MSDVAARAGVSTKTVSNVLRGAPGASEVTRARVHEAVRELGYRFNAGASALRSGRHRAVALAVPALTAPEHGALAERVMTSASGRQVVLELTRGEADVERRLLAGSWRATCDGLILVPTGIDPDDLDPARVPGAVVLVAESAAPGLARVTSPVGAQADLVATHLAETGRRDVVVIGSRSPADRWTDAQEAALRRSGLEPAEGSVVRIAPSAPFRGAIEAVTRLLRAGCSPDAVVCHDDVTASGAASALARHGRRIGEEVCVIGRGDTETARFAAPALTSVDTGTQRLAEAALAALDRLARQDSDAPEPVLVPPALRIRSSSSAATTGDELQTPPVHN